MQYILTSHVTYSLVGKSICFSVQKEHVVLTRCGTGHGIFTHSLLLSNDEQADILRVIPINISTLFLLHVGTVPTVKCCFSLSFT